MCIRDSPYSAPTGKRSARGTEQKASSTTGPTLIEFLSALFVATIFSFRFIGVGGIVVFIFVLTKTKKPTTQWIAFCCAFAMFILPIDVRFTNTTLHHGEPNSFVSISPVFASGPAHSLIRQRHSEYYTSHTINRPRWVVSFDVGDP